VHAGVAEQLPGVVLEHDGGLGHHGRPRHEPRGGLLDLAHGGFAARVAAAQRGECGVGGGIAQDVRAYGAGEAPDAARGGGVRGGAGGERADMGPKV
jgi:hypothetical protein